MPIKFKLYQICAIYMLLWSIGWSGWVIHNIITSRFRHYNSLATVELFILFGVIFKTLVSFKTIKHFKLGIPPGRSEKTLFWTAFAFSTIFATTNSIIVIPDIIVKLSLHPIKYFSGLGTVSLRELSWIGADIAAIYFIIVDLIWQKFLLSHNQEKIENFDFEMEKN